METADTAKVSFVWGRGEGSLCGSKCFAGQCALGDRGGLPSVAFRPLPASASQIREYIYGWLILFTFAGHDKHG